jgi:hypothetical protein
VIFRFSFYILFTVLFAQESLAQHFNYKNFSTEHGLPSSEVYSVIQDSKGYIWGATDAGVFKYNNSNFKTFTTNDGAPDNTIFNLFEDRKGRIWMTGLRHGRGGHPGKPAGICVDYENSIWLSTLEDGLFYSSGTGIKIEMQIPALQAIRVSLPDGQPVSLIVNEIGEFSKTSEALDLDGKKLAARKASLKDFMTLYDATLMNPKVLVGSFIGVLSVFVFSALTMKAVGRAAFAMVQEVRRQFKEKPGIMEGTERPDYARCVAISTAGAQREMLLPSILAIAIPVVVGLVLNVSGIMGLLVGGLTAGFSVAVFMANSGGAWDNAKKYIEAGHLGGKGSMAHKAAVVGDTVGDPFKDTCGPSLNILIKLMTMVSIVFAGLIVKYAPAIGHWLNLGN